jgi:hypothetical protein
VVDGRDRTRLIEGLEQQLAVVRAALDHLGERSVPVAGCLCLVDGDGLPLFGSVSVRGVPVLGARAAARLAGRTGNLSQAAVHDLATLLGHHFDAA